MYKKLNLKPTQYPEEKKQAEKVDIKVESKKNFDLDKY